MVFVRFVLFSTDTVNDFLSKNCPHSAGAIAFYTMFSMFPLFLAIISVLGYIVGPATNGEQMELARKIAELIPVSSQFIGETVTGVVSARAITGIASIFGLFWAATAAFGAIRKGINAAWGIKKTRPFLKERLIDFGLVLGAGWLMLAVLFMAPALGVLREVTDLLAPDSEYFNHIAWSFISRLVSPTLAFLAFLILYRFLPNTEVRIRDVWPGALLASLAFHAANQAFVWYVGTFAHYNLVYGSVGAILALLTWVYLSAIILLFGALITSGYAAYVSYLEKRTPSLKHRWTGFSRVRVRVVESAGTA